jgi:hypothetical protein
LDKFNSKKNFSGFFFSNQIFKNSNQYPELILEEKIGHYIISNLTNLDLKLFVNYNIFLLFLDFCNTLFYNSLSEYCFVRFFYIHGIFFRGINFDNMYISSPFDCYNSFINLINCPVTEFATDALSKDLMEKEE